LPPGVAPVDSPTAVVERIAEIPTDQAGLRVRPAVAHDCRRKVVAQNKKEIEDYLAGRATPVSNHVEAFTERINLC